MGKAAKKVALVGRTASTVFGVALVLALVFGVATTALAGTGVGARFQLGQTNTVNAVTKLVGSVAGPSLQIDNNSTNANATALDLQVEAGKAPMKVNSDAQVANLNSDKVDGKSAGEIGVNGIEQVSSTSDFNSNSGKYASVSCPAGKVVVGSGYETNGGSSGTFPNADKNIVIDSLIPSTTSLYVDAFEEEPTSAAWSVTAYAICATAP